MIKFFDSHFPSRIIFLFILLLAFIGIQLFMEFPYSSNVLRWLIEGEKIGGGNLIYRDLWTSTSFLYSLTEPILSLFGRNNVLFTILGALIIFFQAIYLSTILNKYKILKRKSYLPSLVYIIFMSLHYELIGFSPEVFGMTFVLLAMGNIISMNSKENYSSTVLNVGMFLGLAILCSTFYVYFAIVSIIGITYFSTVNTRNLILLILGILLPILIVLTIMVQFDGFENFFNLYVKNFFNVSTEEKINFLVSYKIVAIPTFFLLLGILKAFSSSQTSNFVSKVKQLFFIWLLLSGVVAAIYFQHINVQHLVIFAPLVSYYLAVFFTSMKRQFLAEFLFLIFIIGTFGTGIHYANLIYKNKEDIVINTPENKIVFILDGKINNYNNNSVGTSFLDSYEAMLLFDSPSKIDLITIYKGFLIDTPEIVYDNEAQQFAKILDRIPILASKYFRKSDGIYWLKVYKED